MKENEEFLAKFRNILILEMKTSKLINYSCAGTVHPSVRVQCVQIGRDFKEQYGRGRTNN